MISETSANPLCRIELPAVSRVPFDGPNWFAARLTYRGREVGPHGVVFVKGAEKRLRERQH